MELISELIGQLGVTNEQAEGGAGLLFKNAKEKLSEGDYSQLASLIPGMDDLIGKSPKVQAESAADGGMMGAIGGVADALGMGDVAEKLENLAGVAGGFGQLGLDTSLIGKFVNTILAFLRSKGGDSIAAVLQEVLK